MREVEEEPSPRAESASSLKPIACVATEKSARRQSLLEHAFGSQMLRGHGEWSDESDVVRSSFLLVAKELRRQDARLRALEAERTGSTQPAAAGGGRWEALQTHVALLGDELQRMARQLSSSSTRALEAAQREQQRQDKRHDRVETRVRALEDLRRSVAERVGGRRKASDSPPPAACAANAAATAPEDVAQLAKETRRLKKTLEASVLPKIIALETQVARLEQARAKSVEALERSQQRCERELRELRTALDERLKTQERAARQRLENLAGLEKPDAARSERRDERDALLAPATRKTAEHQQQPLRAVGARDPVPTASTSRATPTAAAPASSTHSKLKERFACERERQRESLKQLREQSERRHQQWQVGTNAVVA